MGFLWGFLLFIVFIVALIIAYWKLRPLFPVKVNCWFCNHDTQVPYGNRNCWDCPQCDQYNGFTPEGDYNKPVPAQYTEDINHPVSCEPAEFLTRRQYLCPTCQRNQLLKVKQLATFEPLNEATHDEELAFYQHHLESVYALCASCDTVVKRELERLDESLTCPQDTSRDSSSPLKGCVDEAESVTAVSWIHRITQYLPHIVTFSTTVCAMLTLSVSVHCYTPHALPPWVTVWVLKDVDTVVVSLCGLILCIVSKLLHGKQRLHVWDAVHILLSLAVMLTGLFRPHHPVETLCLSSVLLVLELSLALKRRQVSSVTSPVFRRLSLDVGASAANSDAASDAVSSVSTSCRRRLGFLSHDGGDGAAVSVLNTPSNDRPSPSGSARGLMSDGMRQADNKDMDDLDILGKNLKTFLIGPPRSNESGYSSGRSSVFSSNTFGLGAKTLLSTSVPFPRPLISPARLSVLSFSQTVPRSTMLSASKPSEPSMLFSGVNRPSDVTKTGTHTNLFPAHNTHSVMTTGAHTNPFLALDSRPVSMFSVRTRRRSNSNSPACSYRSQPPPPRSQSLFSDLNISRTPIQSKARSEIDFSVPCLKPSSYAKTMTTWWRSSASDFADRDDRPRSMVVDTTRDDDHQTSPDDASGPVECDSTTPQLAQLKISMSPKKRKKTTKVVASKKLAKEIAESIIFSDDEDDVEDQLHGNQSTVSTVLVHSKQDWSWLQWFVVGVVLLSVSTNLFLAWTVWVNFRS